MSQHDRDKAREIAQDIQRAHIEVSARGCYCGNLTNPPCRECEALAARVISQITEPIATALEQRGAEEREAAARKCDERRAMFGAKSLVYDSYTRGLIDGIEGCATAIRETGEQDA